MDEKKFWNYFGHREAYSQDYRISITSFKFDCINCTNFFLFQFSEGFFSFVLEKNFGLEDMSPSLDCKGYLNGLIFNFKVIRISQELDSQHYRISLKQALNSTISTAPFFSFFMFSEGFFSFGLEKFWLRKYVSFIRL